MRKSTKKTYNEVIQEFVDDIIFLHNYTKIENMRNRDYDAKLTVRIGKRIEKNLRIVLQSDDGLVLFRHLLSHDDPYVKFIAARYLFPTSPYETIKIMEEYVSSLTDDFSRHQIEDVVNGLRNEQPVFMAQFKKLYGNNFDKYFVNK